MKRRSFVRTGVIGVTAGLSGCIGPVDDILDNGETIEYPTYYNVIPSSNPTGDNGVFATHVDIKSLKGKFDNPIDDPFPDLSSDNESIGLITGSSLLSIRPTIDSAFQDDELGNEIRSIVGLSDSDPIVEAEEFVLLKGVVAFRGSFDESYVTDDLGLDQSGDNGIYGDSEILLSGDWMIVPLDGNASDYSDLVSDASRVVDGNEDLLEFEGSGTGDVNVIGIDPSVELGLVDFDFKSIISSATFENEGYTTNTKILLSDGVDTDMVNESVEGESSYDEELNVVSVTLSSD